MIKYWHPCKINKIKNNRQHCAHLHCTNISHGPMKLVWKTCEKWDFLCLLCCLCMWHVPRRISHAHIPTALFFAHQRRTEAQLFILNNNDNVWSKNETHTKGWKQKENGRCGCVANDCSIMTTKFIHLHSISSRTTRSTGGASLVFEAWHRNVLLYASLVKCGISNRLTITCRPMAIPPAVWIGSLPLYQVTVGSGRPANMYKNNHT